MICEINSINKFALVMISLLKRRMSMNALGHYLHIILQHDMSTIDSFTQCTDEKSNKSAENKDRTFAGW